MMKAWLSDGVAGPGALRLADVAPPQPAAGEYLVDVEASGLNFMDTLMARGKYQVKATAPFVPGVDVAGRIVSDGGPLPRGTRVVGACSLGGFAAQTVVRHADAFVIGDNMDAAEAMALRGQYPTSLYALRHAGRLRQGESVLVHAAAGGVGSAAVQLARLLGARVVATAGGAAKCEVARQLGASVTIDTASGDWLAAARDAAPKGFDVIFDPVGGKTGADSLRCIAEEGRYLVVGFASGELTSLAANRLMLKNASAVGVLWGTVRERSPELGMRITNEIFAWHAKGELKAPAVTRMPFAQAPQALIALETRATHGKVVLVH